jgi:acyl-CoA synthetase (AMP-forming)/AMP-acid ligase II
LHKDLWDCTGSEIVHRTWGDLFDTARRAAAALRRLGLERGELVAAVLTSSHEASAVLAGAWFAGARVASLPEPARGISISRYEAQLARLIGEMGSRLLVVEDRLRGLLSDGGALGAQMVSFESLVTVDRVGPVEPLERDEIIFVQCSSGSTGEPKGAMLRLEAIEAQLSLLAEALSIDPAHDVAATWLPTSHDMGLFGCVLLPWATGMRSLRSRPERFMMSPRTWLEDCAAVKATLTAGPPLGLGAAARVARGCPPLSLRTWLVGADQITWEGLTRAVALLGPLDVGLETITPAYGLAEATLAVTLGELDAPPVTLDVDGSSLMAGEISPAAAGKPVSTLVSVGRALPGVSVRVEADPGSIGEIRVRTPSLASGYLNNDDATTAAFDRGELRTGDLGLIDGEELYVVGRNDDVIVIGGRNLHVAEIEAELASLPGVRAGCCALIDPRDGSGEASILAEVAVDVGDGAGLTEEMKGLAREAAGIPVRDCLLLGAGELPKTPSGKVQRFRCRELLAHRGRPRSPEAF